MINFKLENEISDNVDLSSLSSILEQLSWKRWERQRWKFESLCNRTGFRLKSEVSGEWSCGLIKFVNFPKIIQNNYQMEKD